MSGFCMTGQKHPWVLVVLPGTSVLGYCVNGFAWCCTGRLLNKQQQEFRKMKVCDSVFYSQNPYRKIQRILWAKLLKMLDGPWRSVSNWRCCSFCSAPAEGSEGSLIAQEICALITIQFLSDVTRKLIKETKAESLSYVIINYLLYSEVSRLLVRPYLQSKYIFPKSFPKFYIFSKSCCISADCSWLTNMPQHTSWQNHCPTAGHLLTYICLIVFCWVGQKLDQSGTESSWGPDRGLL